MKEKDVNGKARDAIRAGCKYAKVYKHNDRQTRGIPDTSVTWAEYTSWLEFKLLEGNQSVHSELDSTQLIELVRLEQQCHRAWVVAYRKATKTIPAALTIYRPTALLNSLGNKSEPVASELSTHGTILRNLGVHGVARFEGHDHQAVVALIKQTHGSF